MPLVETPNDRYRRLKYRCHTCREQSPPLGQVMEGGTGWKCYRIPGWSVPQWFCTNCEHPNAPETIPKGPRKTGRAVEPGDIPRRRAYVYLQPYETGRILWAWGMKSIARAAGVTPETVNRAVTGEQFQPMDMVEVARWILEKRLQKRDKKVAEWLAGLHKKTKESPHSGETFLARIKSGRPITLEALLSGFRELGFEDVGEVPSSDKHVRIHSDTLTLRAGSIILDYMREHGKKTISVRCVRSLVLLGKPYTDRSRHVEAKNKAVERLAAAGLGAVATPTGIDVGGVLLTVDRATHMAEVLERDPTARAKISLAIQVLGEEARAFHQERMAQARETRKQRERTKRAAARVQRQLETQRAEATPAVGPG